MKTMSEKVKSVDLLKQSLIISRFMKTRLASLLLLCSITGEGQELLNPIEGSYGVDYIIVNYPDWHLTEGTVLVEDGFLRDHQCGTKTYDGHQGTDYVIRSFPQMDSGVNVLAIQDGEIVHVTEDLFDRETTGDVSLGLGNYVGIYHSSSNTYSYYAHLKKNSVPVSVGEIVVAGQVIGEVGSSGNSTDPHLHFELWEPGVPSDPTIDPWGTPCDTGIDLWETTIPYDTSYSIWEFGLVNYDTVANFLPASWYPLKERMDLKSGFTTDDPFFTFWALHYGLKIGDQLRIDWHDPNGDLYASEITDFVDQDWWFHYYNHSIPTPPASLQGNWTINLYYNDSLKLTHEFPYGHLSLANNLSVKQLFYSQINERSIRIHLPTEPHFYQLQLYSISGKLITEKELHQEKTVSLNLRGEHPAGLYIVSLISTENTASLKVLFGP